MTVQVETVASASPRSGAGWRVPWGLVPLAVGILALVVPTLKGIAGVSWSTEQGAHGPIVLAIALWLFVRRWPVMRAAARPGSPWLGGAVLALSLLSYLVTRLIGSIVLESAALYGALVATLYLFVGWRAIPATGAPPPNSLGAPPPPGGRAATATQPLRLEISSLAVSFLALFGLPVAQSGLVIYIGQYLLEVRAACGGLNSIISLSAIGLFYAYIRHSGNAAYMALLFVVIVGMAVLANFTRVLILVLITYFFGNYAAQGFLHEAAGMTMFVVALAGTMAFDAAAMRLVPSLARDAT